VKAAARALEVSEPAISGAVGALRRELGDKLYIRSGGIIELTPGGRRLASAASEILELAEETRRQMRDADGQQTTTLRVAATPPFAEFAAGPLLSVFTHRHPEIDVDLRIARREEHAALLADRAADITLGPPVAERLDVPAMVSEPFLRYGLIVVSAPGHTLASSKGLAPAALVSTLRPELRTASADALNRFITTPDATRAMLARGGGVPAERFVHMGTRWS